MHPKTLLEAASELVLRVLRLDHPADAVVSRFLREHRRFGPRERATLADTAYAVLRRKLLFEHLARSGSGGLERRLAILGFAGERGFVQQALNQREQAWLQDCDAVCLDDLPTACRHNLPDWMVEPLHEQLGEEFDALATSLLQPAPLDLRVNLMQHKREQVASELQAQGIDARPTPYSPWGLRVADKPALQRLDAFTRGAIEVQDEGSQLLALLLGAGRGEMVADFCAGAGGKTLAIGAAMRSTGMLYAFDVSAHRLQALRPRLKRSGLSNVHVVAIEDERDVRLKRLAGKFDRVLVDAPCSGLGTLRRNPDLKWRQSPGAVLELRDLQQSILRRAARLVKPGGWLVYATCSLLPEENENVAEAFAAVQDAFVPLNVALELAGRKLPKADSLCSMNGRFLRLWPHRHHTDGFFAAAWQRAG